MNNRILSMSGYGRAVAKSRGWKAVSEIRAVNHRHLDIALNLPDSLLFADHALRKMVRATLRRGHVEVSVSVAAVGPRGETKPVLDLGLARRYAGRFKRLARDLGLPAPRLEVLAQLPGVVSRGQAAQLPQEALAAVRKAVAVALGNMIKMRAREGAALGRDIMRRVGAIARTADKLEREWPEARARLKGRMEERLGQAIERLSQGKKSAQAKEIVGMVERGDISEELTRLRSLLAQFRDVVLSGSPAGRRLDFLAQELQREINTMSAKSADASLTRVIMPAREEIERIREQVPNIE